MRYFCSKVLFIALTSFTTINCNPKIIIFNGTCSVGKSTLVTEVSKQLNNSPIVRCDDIAVPVFMRLIQDNGYTIPEGAPKDLMSFYRIAPDLDNNILDSNVNTEMYKQIRDLAQDNQFVLNDTAFLKEKDVQDCNDALAGYDIIRIFVHCSFDDILTRVKNRNESPAEIDHRPITLPFQAMPIMYRVYDPTQDHCYVDTWTKTMVDDFMKKLHEEFEDNKNSYNKYWIEDGVNFFSDISINNFYDHFKLCAKKSVRVTSTFPFDFVIDTSKMGTVDCAKQIVAWIQQ